MTDTFPPAPSARPDCQGTQFRVLRGGRPILVSEYSPVCEHCRRLRAAIARAKVRS